MRINAVFEGGGVRGIALVGAVKAAERYGASFQQVAGTSSGAIIASLIAAGYTADEMQAMIQSTPFRSFLKKSPWFYLPYLGKGIRVLLRKGMYPGDMLERWVRSQLLAKGVRTFADLPPRKLRIVASDISNGRLLVLPDDIERYGLRLDQLEVARAIRMSTSIPFFFDPVALRSRWTQAKDGWMHRRTVPYYVVDGAVLSNFPLWLFDEPGQSRVPNVPTIGFQLVGNKKPGPKKINGPFTMLYALFATMMDAHDERYIEKHNRFRTIKVPSLDVSATDFDLDEQKSRDLYEAGFMAGIEFFNRWSYANYMKQYESLILKRPR